MTVDRDPDEFHRRRLAEEMEDPEFAEEYERTRQELKDGQVSK